LTLLLAAVSTMVAFPVGIVLALGRRSRLPLVRWFCIGYIELIRGMPLITLLFFGAFVLPLLLPAQWRMDMMARIAICLTLFSSAYLAEVFRGGLQAVVKGQYEAAQALGITPWQALNHIVLPQALRITIGPMASNFIGAVKDTSLVAIVNIYDMTGALKLAMSDPDWRPYFVEMYIVVSAIYLVIGISIAQYGRFLERRYALK
jgi:general L-amino acid transport system permease protein